MCIFALLRNNIYGKVYSISEVKKINGVFEIHPCGNETVSGFIHSKEGILTDFETKDVFTEEDIWNIESFEEEHMVYYKQISII